ncbi:MAG: hypothetical protein IPF77_17075 [Gemmatimonadetes bacterium]|nr:hypothetical protein [Gemmatimonadota bacterium]
MSYQVFGNPAFPYGTTSRLYGSGASSDTVTYWTIEVDWDNAGTYSGQSEALYCIGFESARGRTTKFEVGSNGDFIGYKMPDVGTCRITLDNSTRRFDPYYTSGALYGKLLPGRFIRVRVTYQGVTYPIFHGNISKITPYDNATTPTVVLDCEDGKRWLMNEDTNSDGVVTGGNNALTYANNYMETIYPTRLGGVVTIIANFPSEDLDYIYTLGTQSAITVLNDYVGARSDLWWVAADGVLHIKTMANFNDFTAATPTITESNTLKQFAVPVPWDEIVNDNKSYYYARRAVTSYVMWTGVETPLVAVGASTTYFPQSTYNNEVVPSAISAATISITANTAADGSGTDLSADFDGVISAADAIGCILTVTNNHGSLAGYITAITLTGTVYPADRKLEEDTDAASIAIYGKRRVILDNRMNDDGSYNYIGSRVDSPNIEVMLQARPSEQFAFDLFYEVDTTITKYNITNDPRLVGFISHRWLDQSGQNVLTTLRLEEEK